MNELIKEIHMWLKAHPVRKLIFVMLVIFVSVYIWDKVMDGTKVIDPNDAGFNPEKFKFEDYSGLHTDIEPALLSGVLVKMFPPGTDEAYVDQILVERAGAQKRVYQKDIKHGYVYHKEALGGLTGWVVIVIYDEERKTIDLRRPARSLYHNYKS